MYSWSIILLVLLFAEQILASVPQTTAPGLVVFEAVKLTENPEDTATGIGGHKYDEISLGLFAGGIRYFGQGRKKQITGPLPPVEEASEPAVDDEASEPAAEDEASEPAAEDDKKNDAEDDDADISLVSVLPNKSDWYIDSINGDDDSGDGSQANPFKSIQKLLSTDELHNNHLDSGDTLYLAAGNYNQDSISIDIPELNVVGTLDESGKPVSVLGEVSVLANDVTLMNCEFFNAGVILQSVENVAIYGSIFSGKTKTSLSLLGASNNLISRNDFRSATKNAISINWDPVSAKTSSNNLFLKNYFTHHPSKTTERVILIDWDTENINSISVRNRFVGCAFEELGQGQLSRVIDDYNPPSMVVDHEYSVQFEDCYFKRAGRTASFSELTFKKKKSNLHWKWDDLIDDDWVASNKQYAMTGDRENEYVPRLQFIDGNNDGTVFETNHSAGLLLSEEVSEDPAPQVSDNVDNVAVAKVDEIPVETVDLSAKEIVPPVEDAIYNRSEWYVDVIKGDDESGNGSESNPFRSIHSVLILNKNYPSYVGPGDTVHLATGNYGLESVKIDIPGLSIKGTLDKYGKPVSVLVDDVEIIASGVTLMNCEFLNVGLILQNVEKVHVSNNVFSGATPICLAFSGASNNTISHNEFRSAMYDCVHIYWNPSSGQASSDNVFIRNYFTHRPDGVTDRVIRVNWSPGNNNSISARNRFVGCAFKETVSGQLKRIIDDDSTWWMVVDHKYSLQFEDCYFKRADRKDPFREFVILKKFPDFKWRWDELENDIWVAANTQFSLTGDHKNWNHKPRLQFIDGNKNGTAFEIAYSAGLLPSGNEKHVREDNE